MSWLTNTLTSSIGRKITMALTGLFLISFLAVHLSGNISLALGKQETFNVYSQFMSTHWTIRILEVGLVLGFVIHMITALVLTRHNAAARPVGYAYKGSTGTSTWYSRNMGMTGFIILLFLLLHLYSFYLKYHTVLVPDANGIKDMYTLVIQTLKQEWYLAIYLVSFGLLGMHLNHGFQSAFQTFGLNHKKYTPFIKATGTAISVILAGGFMVVAIMCYFIKL